MTEREEKIVKILKRVLYDYNIVGGCTVGGYGYEGPCLNKGNNEWIISTTVRNHVDSIDAKFTKMIDACLFLLDQCFSSFKEAAEAKEYFIDLLKKNVPDFINEC